MEPETIATTPADLARVSHATDPKNCGCWSVGQGATCDSCNNNPHQWIDQVHVLPLSQLPDIVPTYATTPPVNTADLRFFADVAANLSEFNRKTLTERFSIFDIDVVAPPPPTATPVFDVFSTDGTPSQTPTSQSPTTMAELQTVLPDAIAPFQFEDCYEVGEPASPLQEPLEWPTSPPVEWGARPATWWGPVRPLPTVSTAPVERGVGRGYLGRLAVEEHHRLRAIGLPTSDGGPSDENSAYSVNLRNRLDGPTDRPWARTDEQQWYHDYFEREGLAQAARARTITSSHAVITIESDSERNGTMPYDPEQSMDDRYTPTYPSPVADLEDDVFDLDQLVDAFSSDSSYLPTPSTSPELLRQESPESPESPESTASSYQPIAEVVPAPARGNFARRGGSNSWSTRPRPVVEADSTTAIVTTNDNIAPDFDMFEAFSETESSVGTDSTTSLVGRSARTFPFPEVDPMVEPVFENQPSGQHGSPTPHPTHYYTLQYMQSRVRTVIVPGADQAYWDRFEGNLAAEGGFVAPMQFVKGSLTYRAGDYAHLCAPMLPEGGVELYFADRPPHANDDSEIMAASGLPTHNTYMLMPGFYDEFLSWAPAERAAEPYSFSTCPIYPAPEEMIQTRVRRRNLARRRFQAASRRRQASSGSDASRPGPY